MATNKPKLEIYEDRRGEYRWRLKGGNGETVAVSEGYVSRSGAEGSAEKLPKWAQEAEIIHLR